MFLFGCAEAIALISMLSIVPVLGQSGNKTADSTDLKTWWHNTGEINTETPVQNGNVRQSHMYSIQVGTDATDLYDSFVYETIPRNGNGKICVPGDLTSTCDTDDQITIEPDIGVDMAWTQYVTSTKTVVKITRSDGGSVDPANVIIRPTTLKFMTTTAEDGLLITVPYNVNGHRFSIEFKDNLWEYRIAKDELHSYYVQNKTEDGDGYVAEYDDSMPTVGVEPTNALMIFVSAFPEDKYVPDLEGDVYTVSEGLVEDLTQVTESILYFPPGVYWFTGTNHAILSESISWVHFAPGAYVKGAVHYQSSSMDLRATGFGVLSGEQYVYQANTAENYENIKSDTTSLRMWGGTIASGAKWTVQGVVVNSPPFNSMDFQGDIDSFSVDAFDYKQVGAFFGQTDGMEMYSGSHIRHVFYHCGDDGIKTYYSDVLAEHLTVWKTNNAPIVQFGWYPRDLDNVTVRGVDIIHTRYITQEVPWPRALVGSATSYEDDEDSTSTADTSKQLSNYHITNWRCEGYCPGLLGINPQQNIDTMTFTNVWIEKFPSDGTDISMSTFRPYTEASTGETVALGNVSPNNLGIVIKNFRVGDEKITFAAGNWDASSLGSLNIDKSYEGRWTVG